VTSTLSNPLVGALLAIVAATSWALGAVFVRLGTERLPVTTGTLVSLSSGFVVISTLTYALHPAGVFAVSRTTVLWIALLAVVQFPLGRFLNYKAIRLAGVAPATAVSGSSPLVAALLATFFLHERITLLIVLGTLAVVIGLALVMADAWGSQSTGRGSRNAGSGPEPRSRGMAMFGLLCAAGGAFGYGSSHTIARYVLTTDVPAPIVATYALLFGIVALAAMSFRQLPLNFRASRPALAKMAVAGVFSSFGIFFMYMALARAPVVIVSPLAALYPLVAMGLTHAFLQRLERVTARMMVGGALTALGVALVVIGRPA
jgi:drug/metabolite transporter (DMT)-like permease